MTAPASVDELLPEARQMTRQEGGVPSKDRLMRAFRIGRPKASEIYERLLAERQERRAQARHVMRQVAARKGAGRALPARFAPLPAAPLSPGMGPVGPLVLPQPRPVTEGGQEALAAPLPDRAVQAPDEPRRKVLAWPALVVAAPAFVAIWAGWVELGRLTGFGKVHPLPGIADSVTIDTAITLPIGVEAYAAYAFYVALNAAAPRRARRFAAWSSALAVVLGMAAQVAYHLMTAAHMTAAPWPITTVVSCLPVGVFGLAAALVHLVRAGDER